MNIVVNLLGRQAICAFSKKIGDLHSAPNISITCHLFPFSCNVLSFLFLLKIHSVAFSNMDWEQVFS